MQQDMTKEILKSYRSNMEEIKELQYKLAHLGEGDTMIGNSTILNGNFYPPKPEIVTGFDKDKYEKRRQAYQKRIEKLQQECDEIEQWIEAIPDGLTRRIFRMVYIDGMTQQQVANKLSMDQSAVSKKITKYLQME